METGRHRSERSVVSAGLGLHVLLCSSLLLNALFFAYHFLGASPPPTTTPGLGDGLSWALQAAREAEAVAAIDCSGHGNVFLDGIADEDGRPGCECHSCFTGPNCSVRKPNCNADADSGDPVFMEPYWKRHAAAGAVVFSGWHRLSYITTDGLFHSIELERQIRRLHNAVGNAVVDDKYIVYGTGSIQLINALVYALSPEGNASSPPASVVATAPYYNTYKMQTDMFDGREYRWDGTTAAWANNGSRNSTGDVIEFVTSPNNPDTAFRRPVLDGSMAVVDHAYYWPHLTHIPAPADDDVMLFTTSKLSGHAGSRFGWALIRDKNVAKRAGDYVGQSTMGVSRDTQLRIMKIIKVILANLHSKDDIFAFGYDVMSSRWSRLNAVVSRSTRISLQKMQPEYCTYFSKIREPSPAYAWVKCEWEEDVDCQETLLAAGIISRSGTNYEGGSQYARLSLLKPQDDFDMLLERMADIVEPIEEHSRAPDGSSSIRDVPPTAEIMDTGRHRSERSVVSAGLGLHVLLCSLLLLNALFFAYHFLRASPPTTTTSGLGEGLSWALQAATEAEALAAIDCSGHGNVFLDGITDEDGRPGCECNSCFTGPDCSVRTPNCTADADSGDPVFMEPYWKRHATASAVVFSGWHRLSYITTDGLFHSNELDRQIRRLHKAVGNALVDDKYMVFGSGSSQLINALVYALSPEGNASSPPAIVIASAPYYSAYEMQTVMFDGREYRWDGNAAAWSNNNGPRNSTNGGFMEFVTVPNNPDAAFRKPVLAGSSAVYDHAYYWPHLTHIPAPADEDVVLFTTDENVAKRAEYYVKMSTMGASRDTQLRILKIIKVILANLHSKDDIFFFGHDVMRSKWRRLNAVVSRSNRISLQKMAPHYCTYFKRTREPSPAYAWVKCEWEEDVDCQETLQAAGIISRSGTLFGAGTRHTRLSILKTQDDFDVLLERITDFVDAEKRSRAPAGSSSM
uniref:Alliinase C-terminal domain-containing protein n=1 Tax=Leersia perrieri TaxID=77586 RepID=A0A0D9V4Z5_9ORYZ